MTTSAIPNYAPNTRLQSGVWIIAVSIVIMVIGTKEEHWLCQDDNGKIFDTIVSKIEKGIYENWNAFSPQDGSLKSLR